MLFPLGGVAMPRLVAALLGQALAGGDTPAIAGRVAPCAMVLATGLARDRRNMRGQITDAPNGWHEIEGADCCHDGHGKAFANAHLFAPMFGRNSGRV